MTNPVRAAMDAAFEQFFEETIDALVADGLATRDGDTVKITEKGREVATALSDAKGERQR